MHKYRLNLKFLAFLLAILVVFGGGVYGLWAWQMGNNAVDLEQQARRLVEEGDVVEALKVYRRYFSIVDSNDESAREPKLDLANLYANLIEDNKVHPSEYMVMLQWIEDAVRDNPEDDALRRRMVDVAMRVRRWPDALQHLSILIRRNEDDSQLRSLQTQCKLAAGQTTEAIEESCELIGFDLDEGEFSRTPTGEDQPDVYYNLARELEESQPALAQKIIQKMVEVNPDNYTSYLNRGMYYFRLKDNPGLAAPDLRKAFDMNAEDGMVLLQSIDLAIALKDYDRAREIGDQAIERFPEAHRIYEVMAELEKQNTGYEEAVAQYDRGLANNKDHPILLFRKAELQIDFKEFDQAKKTIAILSSFNIPRQWLDYLEAKQLVMRNSWPKAVQKLERIYTEQIQAEREWGWRGHAAKIDQMLALSYEGLGQYEKALEAYEIAKSRSNDTRANSFAEAGRQRCLARLGRESGDDGALTTLVQTQLALPKGQRNWTQVNARLSAEMAGSDAVPPARKTLRHASILALQAEFEQAGRLGDEALASEQKAREEGDPAYATLTPLDQKQLNKQLAQSALQAVNILLQAGHLDEAKAGVEMIRQRVPESDTIEMLEIEVAQREQGPAVALEMLNSAAQNVDDSYRIRAKKAELLLQVGGDDVVEKLKQLMVDLDQLNQNDQARLYRMMALLLTQFRDFEEAQRYYDLAIALSPNDLPTRMSMFELAYMQQDDEAMKSAQAEIEKVVGTKEDSAWWYTEAKRLIVQYDKGERDPALLQQCEELAAKIRKQRPNWHEAYFLQGQIDFAQREHVEAVAAFKQAMRLGRADMNSLRMYAQSLVRANEVAEARRILEMIPPAIRHNQLARFNAEVMSMTGNHEEALATADKLLRQNPEDSDLKSWHASLLIRAGKRGEALAALETAVELTPESPQNWLRLISYYADEGRAEEAEKALALAAEKVPQDAVAILKASAYQQLGRPEEAEKQMLIAYNADAENPALAQLLAEFYLGPGYRAPDKIQKLTPYLNQLLKLDDLKERTAEQESRLRWARRQAARVLSKSGEYAKVKEAESLIQANAIDGKLELSDQIRLTEILIARHDPESRLQAIALLEGIQESDLLTVQGVLQLARLYKVTNQWEKANDTMIGAVGKFADDPGVWTAYIDMLIERGDRGYRSAYREAEKHLNERLLKLRPSDRSTLILTVRLFDRLDRKKKARQLLALALGKLDELTREDLRKVELIGSLFAQLGDLNNAEVLYRKHYALAKNLPSIERLATFLGQYRDVDETFRLIEVLRNEPRIGPEPAIRVALRTLRYRRDEIGDSKDALVGQWIDDALAKYPDSTKLLLQKSEYLDILQKPDEVMKIYEELLTRDDLSPLMEATVLNNYAYKLGLRGVQLDRAIKLVNDAASLIGPSAIILDTRGVIHTARGEYDQAITDLVTSLTESPDASKYFHLACAYLKSGKNREAIDAWEAAERVGLDVDMLEPLEIASYEQTKQQIDELRQRSGGLS